MCGGSNKTGCVGSNVGSCQVKKLNTKQNWTLGQPNKMLYYYDGMLNLTYVNGTRCHNGVYRTTHITFLCNSSAVDNGIGVPEYEKENHCVYNFRWFTKYACPAKVSQVRRSFIEVFCSFPSSMAHQASAITEAVTAFQKLSTSNFKVLVIHILLLLNTLQDCTVPIKTFFGAVTHFSTPKCSRLHLCLFHLNFNISFCSTENQLMVPLSFPKILKRTLWSQSLSLRISLNPHRIVFF